VPEDWPGILVFTDAEELDWCREAFFSSHSDWRALDATLGIAHAAAAYIPKYAFELAWNAGSLVTAFWLTSYEVKPSDLGLYTYECSFSGSYHRNEVPARPLLVSDLPESLRNQLTLVRIPHAFDKLPYLDPDQYADCQHY
jgi:hypothetical protein